ncbi:hypothetical protein Tco_1354714 [Tanacetum coccineum]
MIQRPSERFLPPYIQCGRIDHLSDDCLYYPICRLCRSYDHDTNGHKRIISLEREIKPRNLQHVIKICETYGSTFHNTTDRYDIKWFKRGEALQAKNVDALKLKKTISSKANRSRVGFQEKLTILNLFVQVSHQDVHLAPKRWILKTYD